DQLQELGGLLLQELLGLRLHVQPQERFGVAGPNVEPPVLELYRQAIRAVRAAVSVRGDGVLGLGDREGGRGACACSGWSAPVWVGRTLNHQSSNSTVRPSVRSGRPPRYAATSPWIL